jgi:hypothetical protein
MKRSKFIILFLVLASMTGCLVSSLHPFYKDQDKYFDTTMVGYWMDGDSAIWTIFPNRVSESFMGPEKPDSTFRITYYEDEDHYSILKGTLFRLNGVDYVDFLPQPDEDHCTSDLTSYHFVPVHTLARVQYCRDSILLYWYGDDWLDDLFEQQRIRIKHETVYDSDRDRHVLTAGTEELQKFILKYANDPKTVQDIEEIFARGDTDDDDYGVFLKLKPYHGPLPEREKNRPDPA